MNLITSCPGCDRTFPTPLVQQMLIDDANGLRYQLTCPICALELTNEIHGLPKGTPFRGAIAQEMYEAAIAFLKDTGQRGAA